MKKRIEVWLMSTYFNEEIPHYSKFFEEQSQKLNIPIDMKVIAWNKAYDKLIDAFKKIVPLITHQSTGILFTISAVIYNNSQKKVSLLLNRLLFW